MAWRSFGDGRYEISDEGVIRRVTPASGTRPGRILSQRPTHDGYLEACISRGKVQSYRRVHQLVAEAFLGPCPPGKEVNHKDGNKWNNRASNLKYVTVKENADHAFELGLRKGMIGEKHPLAILRDVQASAVARLREGGMSWKTISRACGITEHQAYNACLRDRRHQVGVLEGL